jgi:hypothetical protein
LHRGQTSAGNNFQVSYPDYAEHIQRSYLGFVRKVFREFVLLLSVKLFLTLNGSLAEDVRASRAFALNDPETTAASDEDLDASLLPIRSRSTSPVHARSPFHTPNPPSLPSTPTAVADLSVMDLPPGHRTFYRDKGSVFDSPNESQNGSPPASPLSMATLPPSSPPISSPVSSTTPSSYSPRSGGPSSPLGHAIARLMAQDNGLVAGEKTSAMQANDPDPLLSIDPRLLGDATNVSTVVPLHSPHISPSRNITALDYTLPNCTASEVNVGISSVSSRSTKPPPKNGKKSAVPKARPMPKPVFKKGTPSMATSRRSMKRKAPATSENKK